MIFYIFADFSLCVSGDSSITPGGLWAGLKFRSGPLGGLCARGLYVRLYSNLFISHNAFIGGTQLRFSPFLPYLEILNTVNSVQRYVHLRNGVLNPNIANNIWF